MEVLVRVGSHRSRRRGRGGYGGFNPQSGHQGGNQQSGQHGGGQRGPSNNGPAWTVPGLPPPGSLPPPPPAVAGKTFEELTSIDPQPRLTLEYPGCPASCRLIDLFCPIGRGQRGLIVSPPKAGKTTLLKDIGMALLRNHPDVELILLLVDERPEEMTDFRRTFEQVIADLTPEAAGFGDSGGLNGQARAETVPSTHTPGPAQPGSATARCRVIGSSTTTTRSGTSRWRRRRWSMRGGRRIAGNTS